MTDFISVDWGTSSLRAYLMRGGHVAAEASGAQGILSIQPGGHAAALAAMIAPLHAPAGLPIVMSGMIGSRQGWREAPYDDCPTSPDELARALLRWDEPGLGPIVLIPGVMQEGRVPDVMRGEETQIFGALSLMGLSDAVCVMPGTHSKRVEVRAGRIVSFSTFMTGEAFAALKGHTILGRLMQEGATDGSGFAKGVETARSLAGPGALLNAIFGARTLGLTDRLPTTELADYLSGLLIGAELRHSFPEGQGEGVVIGSRELIERYLRAAAQLRLTLHPAPDRCVTAGQALILAAAETAR